ncbi:oligosaccharide flippase family protein [Aminobacterium mobile]|uniref:oligosaccharide flippase family protein n=1 Tax=Aminobacterium mobile TaxID=81467 RepID=UPI00046751C3|nr:oligosaccharide flippase family protein [Aminobacterium mobile]
MKYFLPRLIENLKNKFKSESAVKSVSLLAGGTAIGQAIYVFVTPILSRLYSPSDFGVLAIYAALLSILGAFTSLSYHLAIPLPEEDASATNLLVLSCLAHAGVVCFLSLVIYFKGDFFLAKCGWEAIKPYQWLLPLGVFFTGLYTILTYFALRFKAYQTIAQTKVTQKLFGAGTSVLMGVTGFTPSGLLWGQIIGMTGGITSLVRITKKNFSLSVVNKKMLAIVAKKYYNFPLYQTWGTLLNVLSIQIMPLLLASFFSSDVTGWFAMSMRVLQLPASFLGQSIGQVYFQKASVAQREKRLSDVTVRTLKALVTLGTFPILSLGFIAPDLFPLILGDSWKIAGYYTLFLAPYLWMQFLSSPISATFLIVNKQKYLTLFQGFMLLMGVASLYIGYLVQGTYAPIIIYGIGKFIVYFLYLVIIMKLVGKGISEYLGGIIKEFCIAMLLIIPIIVTQSYRAPAFFNIGAWIFSSLIYVFWILKRKLLV